MNFLAEFLSNAMGRVVVDRTGLSGRFDYEIAFQPILPGAPQGVTPSSNDSGAPPLPLALEEQLGLKLESTRAPVEVLVVDAMQRLQEN